MHRFRNQSHRPDDHGEVFSILYLPPRLKYAGLSPSLHGRGGGFQRGLKSFPFGLSNPKSLAIRQEFPLLDAFAAPQSLSVRCEACAALVDAFALGCNLRLVF